MKRLILCLIVILTAPLLFAQRDYSKTGEPVTIFYRNGRSELVKMFRLYSDMHRFIAIVSEMSGARIGEVVVSHRPRKHGASKYGISRTFKVLSDLPAMKLITRFGNKPLFGFFTLALPFGLSGFILLLLVFWNRLGSSPQHLRVVNETIALLFMATWCFLLLLGLVGELAINATRPTLRGGAQLILEETKEERDGD